MVGKRNRVAQGLEERFPENCREISHTAPDGEIHRADIKTPTGIVIEVQHSAMTDAERESREAFYGNLVWVIDGRGFRDNFDVYHPLPDPASQTAQDIVWSKAIRPMRGAAAGLFLRLSEGRRDYPGREITKATLRSGFIHSLREIQAEVEQAYRGHHQYDSDSPAPHMAGRLLSGLHRFRRRLSPQAGNLRRVQPAVRPLCGETEVHPRCDDGNRRAGHRELASIRSKTGARHNEGGMSDG